MYVIIKRDSKLFRVEFDPEKDEQLVKSTIYRHKGKKGFYFYNYFDSRKIVILSEQEALTLIAESYKNATEAGKSLLLKLPDA